MKTEWLESKITVLLSCLLGLLLVTVLYTFYMASSRSADTQIIDIAGRQRLLSQKMLKETMMFIAGREAESSDIESLKEILVKTVSLFETSLNALRDGGSTLGTDGNETNSWESR